MDSLTQIDGCPLGIAELNNETGIAGCGAGEPGADRGVEHVGLVLSDAEKRSFSGLKKVTVFPFVFLLLK